MVRNAPRIASALGSLDQCADIARLNVSPILPPGEVAGKVRAARRLLSEARVTALAGYPERALELGRRAEAEADRLAFEPLQAEAEYRLGTLLGVTGDRHGQTAAFLAAVRHAEAARHDEYAARALTELIVAAVARGEADEASAWATLAEGAIERFDHDLELTARRLLFLGMLSQLQGDGAGAIAHYEAWLAATPDPGPLERGTAEANIGIAYLRHGRLEEADRHLSIARDLLETGYGEHHPELASVLLPRAEVRLAQGRPERADELFLAAVALTGGKEEVYHKAHYPALAGHGRTAIALGRYEEAIEPLEEAVGKAAEMGGNRAEMATWRFALAEALWSTDRDRRRALDLAREAYIDLAEAPSPWSGVLPRVKRWLAEREGAA